MAANGKVCCSSSSIVRSFKNFLLQLLIFISEIAEEGFQGLSQSTGCFFLGLWKRTFFGNRERLIFCNVTMLCKACWMLAKSAQKKDVLKEGTSAYVFKERCNWSNIVVHDKNSGKSKTWLTSNRFPWKEKNTPILLHKWSISNIVCKFTAFCLFIMHEHEQRFIIRVKQLA